MSDAFRSERWRGNNPAMPVGFDKDKLDSKALPQAYNDEGNTIRVSKQQSK